MNKQTKALLYDLLKLWYQNNDNNPYIEKSIPDWLSEIEKEL